MGCTIGNHKSRAFRETKSVSGSLNQVKTGGLRISSRRSNQQNLFLQCEQDLELQNATKEIKVQTSREKAELRKTFLSHFLFDSLPVSAIDNLISRCLRYIFKPASAVFNQHSVGKNFYIVATGSVEVVVNGEVKKKLGKWDCFGELALLHDTLRTATVRTLEITQFWVLNREDFKAALKSVTNLKYSENKQFIEEVNFFQVLTAPQKEKVLTLLVSQEFSPGDKILLKGDPGDIFYIIKKGTVSCSIDGQEIRQLSDGEYFGEQALIYSTERTATVVAMTKVSVLSLGTEDLNSVFGTHLQDVIYTNSLRISLENSEVFRNLTKEQMETCIGLMKLKCYPQGKKVFLDGDFIGDIAYFIVKGKIASDSQTLSVFSSIGDKEIIEKPSQFSQTWTAIEDSILAEITKAEIEKVIDGELCSTLISNRLIKILKSVHLLRTLPVDKLKILIGFVKVHSFSQGSVIFQQGDPADSFYIVEQGQFEVLKDKTVLRTISKNDFFGERSIIFKETRTATVIAKENSSCWVLTKNDFLSIMDEGIHKQIMKRIELQNDKIELSDLVLVKSIGHGMFGRVFLVYNSLTNAAYALKTVARWKVHEYNVFENIILERKVLLEIDHPMMMKLVKTFKDDQRVYFLMELVQGIDLFDVIRVISKMDEEKSMFYSGCLLIVLQYLHERGIMYRDLKPENVMIDDEGYPKLIDFGTAAIIDNRTYTIVGTPHYMAPEVVKGTGYGIEADLWSLGVMLYEFTFYSVPFAENEQDTYNIYKKIQEDPLRFPNISCSSALVNLLEKLLSKNPVMRGSHENIMKNPWFFELNWEALLCKQVHPPYIPRVETIEKLSKKYKTNGSLQSQIQKIEENDMKVGKIQPGPLHWDEDF